MTHFLNGKLNVLTILNVDIIKIVWNAIPGFVKKGETLNL